MNNRLLGFFLLMCCPLVVFGEKAKTKASGEINFVFLSKDVESPFLFSNFLFDISAFSISRKSGMHFNISPFLKDNLLKGSYIFLDTNYGRVEVGKNLGVSSLSIDGYSVFRTKIENLFINSKNFENKITYYGPKFNGIILGFSISDQNILDMSVSYDFKVQDIDCKIALASQFFKQKEEYQASGNIGFIASSGPYLAALSLGSLPENLFDLQKSYKGFSLGVGYIQGPVSFGLSYLSGTYDTEQVSAFQIALDYKISKYLMPYLQIALLQQDLENPRLVVFGVKTRF